MAEKFINKKDFISNLPKIYGTYTGGFLIFIIFQLHSLGILKVGTDQIS